MDGPPDQFWRHRRHTGAKVTVQVMSDAMDMAQEQHELLMTQYQAISRT